MPTRFHIGLQRAASTYLYDLLASHPDVALPRKGLGFFSNKFDRGLPWYLAQFMGDGVRIDSSPNYFFRGRTVAPR
ncbi:MAG TPA: sulfotransferase, partial [bacterium]|nr:sulfotransferase [bacterium]